MIIPNNIWKSNVRYKLNEDKFSIIIRTKIMEKELKNIFNILFIFTILIFL